MDPDDSRAMEKIVEDFLDPLDFDVERRIGQAAEEQQEGSKEPEFVIDPNLLHGRTLSAPAAPPSRVIEGPLPVLPAPDARPVGHHHTMSDQTPSLEPSGRPPGARHTHARTFSSYSNEGSGEGPTRICAKHHKARKAQYLVPDGGVDGDGLPTYSCTQGYECRLSGLVPKVCVLHNKERSMHNLVQRPDGNFECLPKRRCRIAGPSSASSIPNSALPPGTDPGTVADSFGAESAPTAYSNNPNQQRMPQPQQIQPPPMAPGAVMHPKLPFAPPPSYMHQKQYSPPPPSYAQHHNSQPQFQPVSYLDQGSSYPSQTVILSQPGQQFFVAPPNSTVLILQNPGPSQPPSSEDQQTWHYHQHSLTSESSNPSNN